MKIQQTRAEPFCLAVDYVEYFHLLSLRQANEAHERKDEGKVIQMSETMLAVYLGEYFRPIRGDDNASVGGLKALDSPRAVRAIPYVER